MAETLNSGRNSGGGGCKIKGSWSPNEDATLIKMVEQHGPRNWSLISSCIPGRSGKSCRLRWCNQLSPDVEHRPFTREEDDVIVRAHAIHGNKWSTISRLLHGRTDNAIKNHWNSTLRRRGVAKNGSPGLNGSNGPNGSNGSNGPNGPNGTNNSVLKRPFVDRTSESTQSDPGLKRKCLQTSVEPEPVSCDGPATVLTLFPSGEMKAVGEVTEKNEGVDDVEDKSTVEIENTYLVTIMKRMIAEEVRIYFNELRGKEEVGLASGPGLQAWAQKSEQVQSLARED
ncbi:putative transcription factor MYB-HB-like family [Helianthus anomalus]